jgi:hypothetical protein
VSNQLAPIICSLSLSSSFVPAFFKHALFSPLLKKPTLDPESLSSYRAISNLPFISKVVERLVARRFCCHSSLLNLFPPKQSACWPFHSNETAVLSVHNDLVRSIDRGEISALVRLDISSALGTGRPEHSFCSLFPVFCPGVCPSLTSVLSF